MTMPETAPENAPENAPPVPAGNPAEAPAPRVSILVISYNTKAMTLDCLRSLAAEGRTVLVSSHILSELEEVVDDAVFMTQGETVSSERVAEAAGRARTWRIRLADRDAATAALPVAQALGLDVATLPVDRRDLLVSFAGDVAAAQGLAALVAAGLPVAEFSAASGMLEHTFLDLEGGAR